MAKKRFASAIWRTGQGTASTEHIWLPLRGSWPEGPEGVSKVELHFGLKIRVEGKMVPSTRIFCLSFAIPSTHLQSASLTAPSERGPQKENRK